MKTKLNATSIILWAVYISLLTVLLPHTAWAFDKFEPVGGFRLFGTSVTAWLAAVAFEAAIAVLTHRLAEHMGTTPRYASGRVWWRVFQYRYLNAYALGLLVTVTVSALANFAHAVEFGMSLRVAEIGTATHAIYLATFGGILPFASLLFARVLSHVVDDFQEDSPELRAMKAKGLELTQKLKQVQATSDDLARQLQAVKGDNQKLQDEIQAAKSLPLIPRAVGTYGRDLLAIIAGVETASAVAERHGVSEATVSRDKAKLNGASG